MNTEGPDDVFDGGGCEIIDFAEAKAKAEAYSKNTCSAGGGVLRSSNLFLSSGLGMEDFVLSASSPNELKVVFDRVRGILHLAGWQNFQLENENNVSRSGFSVQDDRFFSPESPVSRLDKFQLPELAARNGKGRWLAIGFWSESVSGEEGIVDALSSKFTIVGRPGYLRFTNGTWYVGASMDQYGPVSVWTCFCMDGCFS